MSVVPGIVVTWWICVVIVTNVLSLSTFRQRVSNVPLSVRTVKSLRAMTVVWHMMSCVTTAVSC